MLKQIDFNYFEWLISQIHIPPSKTYNDLFDRMHNSEFVWTVPHDDNRVHDGLDLRVEFMDGGPRRHLAVDDLAGATILEVLVALSRRAAFTADGDPAIWAWKLVKNLGLNKASDPLTGLKASRVEDTLYSLVWRTYYSNGQGGFFPLKHNTVDQTKIEIWVQMNAYINEMQEL